ncbi:MAG: hypothetical protein KGZ86_02285 [Candidatus Latescibacteria bacterium]|nr:hypothetical protein [Candidatus Latescibacterota bacterium]
MTKLIIIVIDEQTSNKKILNWLAGSHYKIVLMGLLGSDKNTEQTHDRTSWHDLFVWQEDFNKAGFNVSISTEKGSLFNIISTIQSLQTDLLVLPKCKFLSLANDEYEDFLEQVLCPVMLY